ncbi:hypothetical protein ABIC71_001952 [Herbaspirillum seropedicae]|jgi:hypothetical protein|uniref:His-Xaa-Ser repeat protein HxsA2 n=1 Tax=Herbaspirillum seropedicae TaxID=964 RepID=UPI00339B499A
MKKFGFLIPVMTAAAALSSPVEAKVTSAVEDVANTAQAPVEQLGANESFYIKDGERHSLMMKLSESGQMLAYHGSHASHGSHGSHGSHSSHRSGY